MIADQRGNSRGVPENHAVPRRQFQCVLDLPTRSGEVAKLALLDRRSAAPWRVRELFDDLLEDIKTRNTEALDYRIEDLQLWQEWLMLHRFDRRRVNRRLKQYAEGASEWMSSRGGPQ